MNIKFEKKEKVLNEKKNKLKKEIKELNGKIEVFI